MRHGPGYIPGRVRSVAAPTSVEPAVLVASSGRALAVKVKLRRGNLVRAEAVEGCPDRVRRQSVSTRFHHIYDREEAVASPMRQLGSDHRRLTRHGSVVFRSDRTARLGHSGPAPHL